MVGLLNGWQVSVCMHCTKGFRTLTLRRIPWWSRSLSPAKYSHVYNHAIPPWARLSCSSSHFLTIPQYRVLVSWAVERLGGPRVSLQKRSGKKQTAAVTMVVIQMKGRVHRGFWGRGICVGGGGGGRGVAWAKPAWRARKEALRPVGWSRRRVAGISPSSSRLFGMKKSLFIWRRWGCLGAFEMGTIDEEERNLYDRSTFPLQ